MFNLLKNFNLFAFIILFSVILKNYVLLEILKENKFLSIQNLKNGKPFFTADKTINRSYRIVRQTKVNNENLLKTDPLNPLLQGIASNISESDKVLILKKIFLKKKLFSGKFRKSIKRC